MQTGSGSGTRTAQCKRLTSEATCDGEAVTTWLGVWLAVRVCESERDCVWLPVAVRVGV